MRACMFCLHCIGGFKTPVQYYCGFKGPHYKYNVTAVPEHNCRYFKKAGASAEERHRQRIMEMISKLERGEVRAALRLMALPSIWRAEELKKKERGVCL